MGTTEQLVGKEQAPLYLQSGPQTQITPNIREITSRFEGTLEEKIMLIFNLVRKLENKSNNREVKDRVFRRRTAEEIISDNYVTGCTDDALVFITLARASGIPTKYIETIERSWLESEDSSVSPGGHVYAGVYDGSQWVITDPTRGIIGADIEADGRVVFGEGLDSWDLGIGDFDSLKVKFREFKEGNLNIERAEVNLDKMVFKFIDETEIGKLLKEQKLGQSKEDILEIAQELAGKYGEIKREVERRLSVLLPDFIAEDFEVLFTLNRRSDFRCLDKNKIEVDLARLARDPLAVNVVIGGVTHEVFHIWLRNQKTGETAQSLYEVNDSNKAEILAGTLDEGFAVAVSGDSLEEWYREKGLDYDVPEAFDKFNRFLNTQGMEDLLKIGQEGFECMGFFYVVGYEILQAIQRNFGFKTIRQVLVSLDFLELFDKYEEICKTDDSLPKIDFVTLRKIIRHK